MADLKQHHFDPLVDFACSKVITLLPIYHSPPWGHVSKPEAGCHVFKKPSCIFKVEENSGLWISEDNVFLTLCWSRTGVNLLVLIGSGRSRRSICRRKSPCCARHSRWSAAALERNRKYYLHILLKTIAAKQKGLGYFS